MTKHEELAGRISIRASLDEAAADLVHEPGSVQSVLAVPLLGQRVRLEQAGLAATAARTLEDNPDPAKRLLLKLALCYVLAGERPPWVDDVDVEQMRSTIISEADRSTGFEIDHLIGWSLLQGRNDFAQQAATLRLKHGGFYAGNALALLSILRNGVTDTLAHRIYIASLCLDADNTPALIAALGAWETCGIRFVDVISGMVEALDERSPDGHYRLEYAVHWSKTRKRPKQLSASLILKGEVGKPSTSFPCVFDEMFSEFWRRLLRPEEREMGFRSRSDLLDVLKNPELPLRCVIDVRGGVRLDEDVLQLYVEQFEIGDEWVRTASPKVGCPLELWLSYESEREPQLLWPRADQGRAP